MIKIIEHGTRKEQRCERCDAYFPTKRLMLRKETSQV